MMVMETKAARFNEGQVAEWRDEGAVLLQGFFYGHGDRVRSEGYAACLW